MRPRVIHLDKSFLIAYKPPGMPCVPDASRDASLLDFVRAHLVKKLRKPWSAFVGVCSRLDRPASGVCLFATRSKSAQRLTDSFKAHTTLKTYLGIVPTKLESGACGSVDQWLVKDRERNVVRVAQENVAEARRAQTDWRALASDREGRTLIHFKTFSGRPHQVRAAAAFSELGPLLGDVKYSATAPLGDGRRIALHALRIVFPHPTRADDPQSFELPPSDEFAEWRQLLRALNGENGEVAPT